MSNDEKKAFLKARGWSLWYSNDYWVHPKTITNNQIQDYTNYGFNLDDAYAYENGKINGGKPFKGQFLGVRI